MIICWCDLQLHMSCITEIQEAVVVVIIWWCDLQLHDDKITVYISVSVYQQMSLALYDDIILVYIYISELVYQQMSLTLHDDIISVLYIYIGRSTNVPNTT